MNLEERARFFACAMHEDVNHYYDTEPYSVHLLQVVEYAKKYRVLTGWTDEQFEIILAACWCHDLIEDCRLTYNDIKKEVGENVANIVFACTTEKGKTRAERANDAYYKGILATEGALFVKLCDRLANTKYSHDNESGMFKKYCDELPHFASILGINEGNHPLFSMYMELFHYRELAVSDAETDGERPVTVSPADMRFMLDCVHQVHQRDEAYIFACENSPLRLDSPIEYVMQGKVAKGSVMHAKPKSEFALNQVKIEMEKINYILKKYEKFRL